MNFLDISSKTILGKLLRLPLKFLPNGMVIPILQGKLKGKKWIVGSHVHGCWLGSYEYEKRKVFEKLILPGSVVFDIGAHVGFYTLLASELVGNKGKVYAFEPLKRNILYLKKHLTLNKISNVEVFEVAISNVNNQVKFKQENSSSEGHICQEGNIYVTVASIDRIIEENNLLPPSYMKIDIEGGEINALKGAQNTLLKYHPTIFLATHGINIHKNCCEYLKSLNYNLKPINENKKLDEVDELIAHHWDCCSALLSEPRPFGSYLKNPQ